MPDAPQPRVVFRVDARLVHSTLTHGWIPYLRATRLIVLDRALAHDARRRTVARFSIPEGVEVFFLDETEVARAREIIDEGEPTVVVFESLDSLSRAYDAGLPVTCVHVGHVPANPERTEVVPAVCLGPHDLALIEALRRRGVEVEIRTLATDSGSPLDVFLTDQVASGATEECGVLRSEARGACRPTPAPHAVLVTNDLVATDAAPKRPSRCECKLIVESERGLHLRVAHQLAQLVTRFRSSVEIGRDDRFVNAKSLLGLTTLGAARGTELTVIADGPDAQEAVAAIAEFFKAGSEDVHETLPRRGGAS